ncbi:unnamed protein product [Owenia fusiformis]|uniref:Uncharacterized protein n=1 Tax=Owenia fusiformis TaxID=6347 RepID=A0A8J1XYU8_OWEFU|nr:unnamed protein product [Owenia fusiformis]
MMEEGTAEDQLKRSSRKNSVRPRRSSTNKSTFGQHLETKGGRRRPSGCSRPSSKVLLDIDKDLQVKLSPQRSKKISMVANPTIDQHFIFPNLTGQHITSVVNSRRNSTLSRKNSFVSRSRKVSVAAGHTDSKSFSEMPFDDNLKVQRRHGDNEIPNDAIKHRVRKISLPAHLLHSPGSRPSPQIQRKVSQIDLIENSSEIFDMAKLLDEKLNIEELEEEFEADSVSVLEKRLHNSETPDLDRIIEAHSGEKREPHCQFKPKRCWCTRCQIMYRLHKENDETLVNWGHYPCHHW